MRAKEFTINVPINIKINGDGDPEIDVAGEPQPEDAEPVFISPQQQELELKKSEQGKKSVAGAQLLDDADEEEIA
tara:strand:+ start:2412 stop:2636 length:225 start_codon:yes stop_codon:yes gene_type:complete